MDYRSMSNEALSAEKADLEKRYADFKARGLKLNMARGKPGVDQLDLSMPMLDILNSTSNTVSYTHLMPCRRFLAACKQLFDPS